MKPVRRTKSRTLPIAEPVPTATTSAAAATATSRRRRRWCAPERLSTSSQSAVPGRDRKEALEAAAVEIGHVRASSSRVRSAPCAALRVAATVPVVIPSASPIAA